MGDDRVEGARGGEGADVQLVEDVLGQRQPVPGAVVPVEGEVHDLRRAVHAARLRARSGVGPLFLAVQAVEVEGAGSDTLDGAVMVAAARLQGDDALRRAEQADLDGGSPGRPDKEAAGAAAQGRGAQRA
jgi:hypothetical protein